MEPVLSVTVGALFAVVLTNVVWWKNTRGLQRGRGSSAMKAELQGLKADLVGQHLALLDAVRPMLTDRETEPSTSRGMVERIVRSHRHTRGEVLQLQGELGTSRRKVAQLKRQLARHLQGDSNGSMRAHLAQVSSERDALQEKVSDLALRVRKANPTSRDALHAARQEIDRLRDQLRSANHAIAALDVAPMGQPLPLSTVVHVDLEDDATEPSQHDQSRPPVALEFMDGRWV